MHHCGAGHLVIVPLAALAALGWWVLRVNEKDGDGAIKWAGRVVGWALVVIGLSGAACAGASHIKGKLSGKACCGAESRPMSCGHHGMGAGDEDAELPPGHPPIGGMTPEASSRKKTK